MIQINLLPESELKGRSGGKRPFGGGAASADGSVGRVIVPVFALLILACMFGLGSHSWNTLGEAKRTYRELRAQKKKLDKEVANFSGKAKEIKLLRDRFSNKIEVLRSLDPPQRVLWSEKIGMLAQLIPAEIFLDKIELEENVTEVELQSSIQAREQWIAEGKKKGEKPPVVKKPVITYTLKLDGLTTGIDKNEQYDNVLKFQRALRDYETVDAEGEKRRFMDGFVQVIGIGDIEATNYEGIPVNKFSFELKTAPMEEKEPVKSEVASAGSTRQGRKQG